MYCFCVCALPSANAACLYVCPHQGNYEEPVEMCLIDEELRSIVREDESIGWAFVNEGTAEKPKVGPRCSGDRGEGCMVVWAKFVH